MSRDRTIPGRSVAVFAILLGAYLATSSFRIETIDTAVRLEVARGLVERGSPDVPRMHMRTPFGVVGSFEGRDGKHYSVYGLGQSLLMIPFVRFGGELDSRLVTLINPLATAATGALLVMIASLLGYSGRAGVRLGLLFGLCTLAWPQSKLTFEAPLEMLALVVGVYGLMRSSARGAALAGLAFGFALLLRPSAVLMAPGLGWLLSHREPAERGRAIAAFLAGAIPGVALAFSYNGYRWGSLFATGYSFTRFRYFALQWEGIVGLLVSPGRGFFWFSPVLLLALGGFRELRRERPALTGSILWIAGTYVAFLSFTTVWNGDWTWGPRHLLPLVPVLALGLLPRLESFPRPKRLFIPLISISVFVQLVGATMSYETYYLWYNEQLRKRGVVERVGRYHFNPRTSQLLIQSDHALRVFRQLPARYAHFRRDPDVDPYRSILTGSPDETRGLPDVWWILFPLSGVPVAASIGLGAVIGALVAGSAAGLRRAS
jgi:hypothetical protein